jgi:hypothetical protein
MSQRAILFRDIDPIATGIANVPLGSLLIRTTAGSEGLYQKIGAGTAGSDNWARIGSSISDPAVTVDVPAVALNDIAAAEETLTEITIPNGTAVVGTVFIYDVYLELTGNNAATPTLNVRVGGVGAPLTGTIVQAVIGPTGNTPVAGNTQHHVKGLVYIPSVASPNATFQCTATWHKVDNAAPGAPLLRMAQNAQAADVSGARSIELTLASGNAANSYRNLVTILKRVK